MKMKFALLLAMMVGRAMAEGEEGGAETPDTARRDAVAPLEPGRLFERGMVDINQPITITSERFEYDNKQLVAIFDENVKVVHPQFYMEAEQVFVFVTDTKPAEVKNILAQGSVVMTNANDSAVCDWALYTRAEGTLVMRGKDGALAHLTRGNDTAMGREITIWVEDERMTIEGSSGFIFTPGGAKKNKEPQTNPVEPGVEEDNEETPPENPKPAPSLYIDPEAVE